ncbi:hypothetical protein KEJ27_08780 [Candidatus Bathyarchaeota archaeon]|nr:hypothetical protein [Candidatus Bathyarchaeota archaeon]MBS7613477.1 hypothetical protein [Candidatus Bathyarchaeota archaeon]MBS7617461.1 hypothetical protein [Candidatus Bathyarchaeota archaeon]
MSRNTLAIFFSVLWSILLILALTWSTEYVWPDYVHVNYGYPLVWGVHVLNTLHGPVDIWRINLTALYVDLAVWLGMMIVCLFLILHTKTRK